MKNTIGLLFAVLTWGFCSIAMAIEEPKYSIVETDDKFELRAYAPMIIAEVSVQGSLKSASNQGFRLIADYIFGNNIASNGEKQKVAMTAPVTVQAQPKLLNVTQEVDAQEQPQEQPQEQEWKVHFVMPSEYSMSALPKPNNPKVKLKEVSERYYASLRFAGLTGEKKVARKTKELQEWMATKNLTAKGQPELARYNPPWTLPFARRNEVLIEVEKGS